MMSARRDWSFSGAARRALACALATSTILSACGGSPAAPDGLLAPGVWGGEHVTLTVSSTDATIEFDCAHGTLAGPIRLAGGAFDAAGTYVQEHGGPIRVDEVVVVQPARYVGRVDGRSMSLDVRLLDGSRDLGRYTLTRGASGRVLKCL